MQGYDKDGNYWDTCPCGNDFEVINDYMIRCHECQAQFRIDQFNQTHIDRKERVMNDEDISKLRQKFPRPSPSAVGDGSSCQCMAHHDGECACGADWTPHEVYDAHRAVNEALDALEAMMGRAQAVVTKDAKKAFSDTHANVAVNTAMDILGEK